MENGFYHHEATTTRHNTIKATQHNKRNMEGVKMELYRPSNGTEGDWFMGKFCEKCIYHEDGWCDIIDKSFWFDTDDKEYPQEWQYDGDNPICTKFNRGE